MKIHLQEAEDIAEEIEDFEFEDFNELKDIYYFYAAKGNVCDIDNISLKYEKELLS